MEVAGVSNNKIGCFGFLVICAAIGIAWQAVLYIGIPLAIIGLIAAFMIHKRYSVDETVNGDNMRLMSWVVGTAAVVLGLASIAGNIYTEDGVFSKNSDEEKATSSVGNNIIPTLYQGKWASDGDCDDPNSTVRIDNDDIDFLGGGSFVADTAAPQGARSVVLTGDTIVVADSLANSGYQKDTVKLEVSEDGRTIWIKGSPFRRCGGAAQGNNSTSALTSEPKSASQPESLQVRAENDEAAQLPETVADQYPSLDERTHPNANTTGHAEPTKPPITLAARNPIPRSNPANWITASDYPLAARREGRGGTVGFTVIVSNIGRVDECRIGKSSGHRDLDDATCKAVALRARFEPAVNKDGAFVAGSYSNYNVWKMGNQ
jgi:TonB family protein